MNMTNMRMKDQYVDIFEKELHKPSRQILPEA